MFRFLHTADWQLGKAFGMFDAALAGRLRAERVEAVERIRDLADSLDIRHVVVAGDVWDSEQPSDDMVAQPLEILGVKPNIHYYLLPGNHDPARPQGLWKRIKAAAPANVTCLLSPEPHHLKGASLLPAPWTSKRPGRDLTDDLVGMETPEGNLRIGVAHGSTANFQGEASVIDLGVVEQARLDYLALGDWHGRVEAGPRAWYAGTPEPDRFPRNDPGWVLEVELSAGAMPKVTPHRTGVFDWRRVEASENHVTAIDAALEGADARRVLLRAELSGSLPRAEMEALEAQLAQVEGRLAHLRRRGEVVARLSPDDLDRLDVAGEVREVAERLSARAEEDADARRALDLLFDISATLNPSLGPGAAA